MGIKGEWRSYFSLTYQGRLPGGGDTYIPPGQMKRRSKNIACRNIGRHITVCHPKLHRVQVGAIPQDPSTPSGSPSALQSPREEDDRAERRHRRQGANTLFRADRARREPHTLRDGPLPGPARLSRAATLAVLGLSAPGEAGPVSPC